MHICKIAEHRDANFFAFGCWWVSYSCITSPWMCLLFKKTKTNMISTSVINVLVYNLKSLMDTVDIKTLRFSGFLDTLYPDKPFIHHNPSMWQPSRQTTPRLWSHDSGLFLIIKTDRGRCSCVMLQWRETWRRHCTKTKTFSQLCRAAAVSPVSPEDIDRSSKRRNSWNYIQCYAKAV